MTNIQRSINEDAYDTIFDMGFDLIEVLQIFGKEAWENNNELNESYSLPDTIDAFVELMLN
jgi:hypothetical protein